MTFRLLVHGTHLFNNSAAIEKSLDVSFELARPQKGHFCELFVGMCIKCEVQKFKI